MASKTLLELTTDTPATTDLLYYVKNPGGTPLDRAVTLTALKGAVAPTLNEHQIGFGSASNLLTGNAGFTFDPTFAADFALTEHLTTPSSGAVRGFGVRLDVPSMASLDAVFGLESKITTDGGTTLSSVTAINVVSYPDAVTTDSVGIDIYTSPASAANAFGIRIDGVTGGMTNRSILTGAGVSEFGDEVQIGGDDGGKAARTSITNVVNTTLTNVLVVKGPQAGATPNDGLMKFYVGTQAVLVPYWNAP